VLEERFDLMYADRDVETKELWDQLESERDVENKWLLAQLEYVQSNAKKL